MESYTIKLPVHSFCVDVIATGSLKLVIDSTEHCRPSTQHLFGSQATVVSKHFHSAVTPLDVDGEKSRRKEISQTELFQL